MVQVGFKAISGGLEPRLYHDGVAANPHTRSAPSLRCTVMRVFSVDSPLRLPWTTLRLAGRYFLPLAAIFAAGQAVRWGIIQLGVLIGPGDASTHQWHVAATLTLLVAIVLVSGLVPVLMLYSVRHGILGEEMNEEPLISAMSRALLPFVIIYFSWGMITDDAAAFSRADLEKHADRYYTQPGTDASLNPGGLLLGISFTLALIVAFGCYFIRALFEFLANRRQNRVYRIIAAVFETGWNVFGIMSITQILLAVGTWIHERHIWTVLSDFFTGLGAVIPGWDTFWGMFADAWPNISGAVILSLMWLAIAAAVYGREVLTERESLRGSRLERLYDKYEELSPFRRWSLDHILLSYREQWAPITGAFRLGARAGAVAIGLFCLLFVGIDNVTQLAARGVIQLIGWQQDQAVWGPIVVPIEFVRDLLRNVLQMCLLAGMFDLAVRHERRRLAEKEERAAESGVRVSAGTPAPERAVSEWDHRTRQGSA